MRTFKFFCVCICLAGPLSHAAERPTLLRTNDPRPDILPRPFYDNHIEYRARYNRPRFIGGFLAYEMSRTSQEAMVWKENYCAGNYDQHHMPPVYKTYNFPKPWEALNVGARPDFASANSSMQRVPTSTNREEIEDVADIAKEVSEKNSAEKSSEKSGDDGKSNVKEGADGKREVVPSPSDKSSSRSTSAKRVR